MSCFFDSALNDYEDWRLIVNENNRLFLPIFIIVGLAAALVLWALLQGTGSTPGSATHKKITVTPNDIPIRVITVSERRFDNKPALAILFSTPLDPKQRYDKYLTVTKKYYTVRSSTNGAWVLSDNRRVLYYPHINPETQYEVRIKSGLPAANGSKLKADKIQNITTRKITAFASFASKGNILPSQLNNGLPIVSVNTPEVDLQFMRVKKENLRRFLYKYSLSSKFKYYNLKRINKIADSVYANRFRLMSKKNQRTITHIPLKDIKELSEPGLYIAVLSIPGNFDDYDLKSTLFLVTDIGLHSRLYKNKLHVYTSSLKTGKPLDGVTIRVIDRYGNLVDEGKSDAEGLVKLNNKAPYRGAVVAFKNNEFSLLSFKDPALDLSEFNTSGNAQRAMEAFVYGNRDLFRPGEPVDFSILLRDHDGSPVKDIPLNIRIKRPDGKVMRNFTLHPHHKDKNRESLGYYFYRFNTRRNAQTGKWQLEVRTDPGKSAPTSVYRFRVEEFLPERMKLELTTAKDFLSLSDMFIVQINGAYLYGAPAAGNRITSVVNRYPERHPLKQYKEFYFGNVAEEKNKIRDELPEAKLDKRGRYTVTLDAGNDKYDSPMAVRLTTSLFESGGRPVTRSIKRVVWPSKALLGVRPLFKDKYASENSNAEFEVIKVRPDGTKLPASNLKVQLIREERRYYWTYSERRGWHYEFSQDQYPVLVQDLKFTAKDNGKLSLPVKWGSYRLEITDPETGRKLAHRFYAGYNWSQRQQANNARPDKINMTFLNRKGKKGYLAGDTVKIKLVPPHAGEGIVLIESDRMLWSKRIHLPAKGTTVEFKVADEWATHHNLYVSAVVFRPGNKINRITPNRALGILHLPMDRSQRRLLVHLEAPEKMRPQRKLKVKVKVDNLSNQQAVVTVSAVDLGILNITDYKTPKPEEYFFSKRLYAVQQYDVYSRVIENMQGVQARLRFGGDAPGGANQNKRADAKVKIVALFSGPVWLDKNGEAEVELPVPDYNGSLRIMAVAFSKDRFGSSEREITVAAPVIAELAMPRFLSPGDKSTLTLDLHNLSGQAQNLELRMQVSDPLGMTPVKRRIALKHKEKKVLRFALHGKPGFGVGKIKVHVTGQDVDLKREWELGVRPAYPGVRRVVYKLIQPNTQFSVDPGQVKGLMPGPTDGTLIVSSTPPLNIRGAVKGLLSYPYGCLEQTTSRAFPLVYIDEQTAKRYGLKPMSREKRVRAINDAITRIRSMQLTGGGFGLWSSNSPEEPWLTPYVLHFLLEAKDHGFAVPDDMLQAGLKNLERRIKTRRIGLGRQFYTKDTKHLALAVNAYAGYVLARVQRAPLGTLRTLYDNNRQHAKSSLPLVHLGLALIMRGDRKRGMDAIRLGLRKQRNRDVYLGDYGTVSRDMALSYALLARHGIKLKEKGALVFALGREVQRSRYYSTQERLAIFLAGHALEKNSGKRWAATLTLPGSKSTLDYKGRMVRRFSYKQIEQGIRFQSQAQFPLYAMFVTNGYPLAPPKQQNSHIDVVRTLYDMKGRLVNRRNFKVGELLVAHLSIRGDQRTDNALVVDLLPAGFEVENLNLSRGETLDDLKISGKYPKQVMNNSNILHQEYRDDRFVAAIKINRYQTVDLFYMVRVVSPGQYRVPQPLVEDMYRPEWRGIGQQERNITVSNVGAPR